MLRAAVGIAAGLGLLSGGVSMVRKAAPRAERLELDHVHVGVKDIPSALAWFERVLLSKPTYQDERMAILALKPMTIILDSSSADAVATLSFRSKDVDEDYERLVSRGAVPIGAPDDKPYGVRSAYIKGPGSLKIELEGPLKAQK